MSVLRSLSALQMYHRATLEPVSGPASLHFLVFDERFPRSLATCLAEIESGVRRLPRSDEVLPACEEAHARLADIDAASLDASASTRPWMTYKWRSPASTTSSSSPTSSPPPAHG